MRNKMPLTFFVKGEHYNHLILGKPGRGYTVVSETLNSKTASIDHLAFHIKCMLPKDKPFRVREIHLKY